MKDKKFHIYPIESVDQAVELLTGKEAGGKGIGPEKGTRQAKRAGQTQSASQGREIGNHRGSQEKVSRMTAEQVV